MKHLFDDMLGEATRLTRGGNLQAATELIQRTLRGDSAPATGGTGIARGRADAGLVIDAETRVAPQGPRGGRSPTVSNGCPAAMNTGADDWPTSCTCLQTRRIRSGRAHWC